MLLRFVGKKVLTGHTLAQNTFRYSTKNYNATLPSSTTINSIIKIENSRVITTTQDASRPTSRITKDRPNSVIRQASVKLSYYTTSLRFDEGIQLLRDLKNGGHNILCSTLLPRVLDFCIAASDADLALSVWEMLQDSPSAALMKREDILTKFVVALCRGRSMKPDHITKAYEIYKLKTEDHLHKALQQLLFAAARAGEYDFYEMLEQLLRSKLPKEELPYDKMIDALGQSNVSFSRACKLYTEAQAGNYVTPVVYQSILAACCNHNADVVLCNILEDVFTKHGSLKRPASPKSDNNRDSNLQNDNVESENHNPAFIERIFSDGLLGKVLQRCSVSPYVEKLDRTLMHQVLSEIMKIGKKRLNQSLESIQKFEGSPQQLERKINQMIHLFASMEGADAQLILSLFELMRKANVVPTLPTFNNAISASMRADRLDIAKELVVLMRRWGQEPNSFTYTCFISHYSRNSMISQAFAILQEMVDNQIPRTPANYISVLNALFINAKMHDNQLDPRFHDLEKMMQEDNLLKDPAVLNSLVFLHATIGEYERSLDHLKNFRLGRVNYIRAQQPYLSLLGKKYTSILRAIYKSSSSSSVESNVINVIEDMVKEDQMFTPPIVNLLIQLSKDVEHVWKLFHSCISPNSGTHALALSKLLELQEDEAGIENIVRKMEKYLENPNNDVKITRELYNRFAHSFYGRRHPEKVKRFSTLIYVDTPSTSSSE